MLSDMRQSCHAAAAEARANAARAASLVAGMTAFHHGSRVGDWAPLCDLASRLLAAALPAAAGTEVAEGQQSLAAAAEVPAAGGDARAAVAAGEAAETADLTTQALRLLQAVLIGHCQVSVRSARIVAADVVGDPKFDTLVMCACPRPT